MNKFAVFDIDGTIFRSSLYIEVVSELIKLGALPEDYTRKVGSMKSAWLSRESKDSYREYLHGLVVDFVDLMATVKTTDYQKACQNAFERTRDQVYVYTRDLVNKLKNDGYFLIAISGSQLDIVELFAKYYGFDTWVGEKQLADDNGYLTGQGERTGKDKHLILEKIIKEHSLTLDGSIAVGDSEGDKEMLEMVENPIAFNPEQQLHDIAREKSWKIVVERKNVIYELEPDGKSYILA